MFPPPGAELEVLGAEGGFEDEHVEVDHGGGARGLAERVAGLVGPDRARAGRWWWLDILASLRGALDDGIDRIGHVFGSGTRTGSRSRSRRKSGLGAGGNLPRLGGLHCRSRVEGDSRIVGGLPPRRSEAGERARKVGGDPRVSSGSGSGSGFGFRSGARTRHHPATDTFVA